MSQVLGIDLYTLQFSRSVVSDSLRPHGLQHAHTTLQNIDNH